MPRVKAHHEASSNMSAKPYSGMTLQRMDAKETNNNEAPKTIDKNKPNSPQNVLLKCMKYHKESIETIKKQNLEKDEKVQKTNITVVEKNHLIAQLQKQVKGLEHQVEELKNRYSEMVNKNNVLNQTCEDLNEKYTYVETAYDQELVKFNSITSTQKTELLEKEKRIEELMIELNSAQEQHHQMIAHFESAAHARENQMAELLKNYTHHQERYSQLEQICEQQKLMMEKELEAMTQLKESTQAQMEEELQQQAAKLAEQIEYRAKCDAELQQALKKLEEMEKQCFELQQYKNDHSSEVASTKQRFEGEVETLKVQIHELSDQNRNIKVTFATDERRYQSEIKAFKEAYEQLKLEKGNKDAEAQQERSMREMQEAEFNNHVRELEQQLSDRTKSLSEQNAELLQHLQEVKQRYETMLSSSQEKMTQKDGEIAAYREMEGKYKGTIAELEYKVNSIKKTAALPIGSASVTRHNPKGSAEIQLQNDHETVTPLQPAAPIVSCENSNDSTRNLADQVLIKATATRTRRKPAKRFMINSDFSTDSDDDEPNWQPVKKKLVQKVTKDAGGGGNRKMKFLSTQSPLENCSPFDKLK